MNDQTAYQRAIEWIAKQCDGVDDDNLAIHMVADVFGKPFDEVKAEALLIRAQDNFRFSNHDLN